MFRRDPSIRGYNKTSATVLLSLQLRQILVYYNCKTNKDSQEQKKRSKDLLINIISLILYMFSELRPHPQISNLFNKIIQLT